MKHVFFREGLKLHKMFCPFCRSKKKAVVFQNRIRWMLRFNCGHIKVAGFIMPPDVLEDHGLANYDLDESPIYAWENRNRRQREEEKLFSYDDYMRHAEQRTGTSRYTPIQRSTMQISTRAG